MTPEKTARAYIDALNRKDMRTAKSLLAPDAIMVDMGEDGTTRGRNAILREAEVWARAFPDQFSTVTHTIAVGDEVIVETTTVGTNTGEWIAPIGAAPPTGRRMGMRSCAIYVVSDGQIAAMRVYVDKLALLTQLGILEKLLTR